MDFSRSRELYERAREVIPGGIPGIRAPDNFVPGAYPVLLASGRGGRVTDVDGNEFVDLLLGYGPVILGHAEEEVDAAAQAKLAEGFCLNLPEPAMVELAERLVRCVPSAESVLFFKTGSGATSGAVRLARAHTGRTRVLRCGYHGWHDWCVGPDPGVPAGHHEDTIPFPYNDLEGLEALLQRHAGQVAGIILTPIGHEFDRQIETPEPGFLEGVRRLADAHEAVLIFDEVRSGFRVAIGGAQALYGVTPDLTALGKAMGNGYAIAALAGRRDVMSAAHSTFISSTFFPNGLEMSAALATLELLEREAVLDAIERGGREFAAELATLAREESLPVTLSPYAKMPFVHFDPGLEGGQAERRDGFYRTLAEHGVFAHPRHHGFLCWRHGDQDRARVLEAMRTAARGCR